MAQQDYFSKIGGQYGQLAGSILSDKRRRKKKDAFTALAVGAFVETLGAKNRQLQQGLADSIEEIKDNYADIFQNNKDIWDENATKRADLRLYEKEYSRDSYLNDQAIKLFNEDEELRDMYGSNAWSRVKNFGEGALPADEYKAAQDLFDDYKKLAEDNIKTYSDNPEIGKFRTYTQFNALAKKEYKAALEAVKNDPTKKGAIRSWFNKRFGTDSDGKPRYGMIKKAELELIRENAASDRKAQDSLTEGNTLYKENKEKDNTIYKRIKEMREKYTGFKTTDELIASKRISLKKKIETGDFTTTDIENFISFGGTATTNISEIDELLAHEIPNFVDVFTKVVAMREQKQDVSFDPTDFLNPRELNIYDLGMGIERDEGLVYTPQEVERIRSGLVSSIKIKMERDKNLKNLFNKIEGEFTIDKTSGKDASLGQSSIFISNIIRAATKLQNKYDMEETEALDEALKMQVQGIEIGVGPEFNPKGWKKEYRQYKTSVVDYVDPDVALLPIIPETAIEIANNVNNTRWLQQKTYKDENDKTQTWEPAKEKMFIYDEDEGFKIIFKTRKNKKTEKYEWYPEIDFGRNDPYGYIP